ncbi:MAG: hypothetical protein ACI3V0_03120 [Faecousia sp.]
MLATVNSTKILIHVDERAVTVFKSLIWLEGVHQGGGCDHIRTKYIRQAKPSIFQDNSPFFVNSLKASSAVSIAHCFQKVYYSFDVLSGSRKSKSLKNTE